MNGVLLQAALQRRHAGAPQPDSGSSGSGGSGGGSGGGGAVHNSASLAAACKVRSAHGGRAAARWAARERG